MSFDQAVSFLVKFGFIAEISRTTEFLEERHPWSKEEEKRVFIVPVQLPADKGEKVCHFSVKDAFGQSTRSSQMVSFLLPCFTKWSRHASIGMGKEKKTLPGKYSYAHVMTVSMLLFFVG